MPPLLAKLLWIFDLGLDVAALWLFTWMGSLQFNDPDALSWVAIYFLVSLIIVLSRVKKLSVFALFPITLVYTITALLMLPDFGSDWIASEEAREGVGVGICAIWLIFMSFRMKFRDLGYLKARV